MFWVELEFVRNGEPKRLRWQRDFTSLDEALQEAPDYVSTVRGALHAPALAINVCILEDNEERHRHQDGGETQTPPVVSPPPPPVKVPEPVVDRYSELDDL